MTIDKTSSPKNSILDRIVSTLGNLPASPAIVSTVMGLVSNPDSKVDEISKVLSADQSLTAKVLKLSNSSFYGRPQGVKTLEDAILLLGFYTVRSIVVATSAHAMYTKEEAGGPQEKLWQHSLATAVAARQIAKHISHPDKDEVFIAALLHDIGKLVVLQKMRDVYMQVIAEVETECATFTDVELRHLGFTHCEVAAILLEHWQFPESLRDAVLSHHTPVTPAEGQPVPVSMMIFLGNQLGKRLGVGFNDHQIEDLAGTTPAKLMALDEAALDEVLEETKEHYQTELNILEGS